MKFISFKAQGFSLFECLIALCLISVLIAYQAKIIQRQHLLKQGQERQSILWQEIHALSLNNNFDAKPTTFTSAHLPNTRLQFQQNRGVLSICVLRAGQEAILLKLG